MASIIMMSSEGSEGVKVGFGLRFFFAFCSCCFQRFVLIQVASDFCHRRSWLGTSNNGPVSGRNVI